MRTYLTKEEIRSRLPGFRREEILLGEEVYNGRKTLKYIYEIRGFMNELVEVRTYWVESPSMFGSECRAFSSINEAVDYYVKK